MQQDHDRAIAAAIVGPQMPAVNRHVQLHDPMLPQQQLAAAASARPDQAEPLRDHERVIADHGRRAKKPGHALAAEKFFMRPAPSRGIGIATALSTRILIINTADRNHRYLGQLDHGPPADPPSQLPKSAPRLGSSVSMVIPLLGALGIKLTEVVDSRVS
jgi:hypothetical protein